MIVFDYLGAGLPVLAYDYGEAIREGLEERDEGRFFKDAKGLAELIEELAFRDEGLGLQALREGVKARPGMSWMEEWQRGAKEVILGGP